MSTAAPWKTAVPDCVNPPASVATARPFGARFFGLFADYRNVPRYVLKYGILALAILGGLQLWLARGDGPMPAFSALPTSAGLDPYRVSSPHCVILATSDQDRWEGLAAPLAILRETNPDVARWLEKTHVEGRLVFVDHGEDSAGRANSLARFDHFQSRLRIYPGLFAEPDGAAAAVLCHEYRHSRQRFPKILNHALSFLFSKGGDPSIVEHDAVIFEQEARCAIFGEDNEALEGLAVRLAEARDERPEGRG